MRRRAGWRSQRGVLLVEAVLSVIVIAVGLVFITQSVGHQLKALRSIEEYDRLGSLARSHLLELEARRLFSQPLPPDRQGVFQGADDGGSSARYRWEIRAMPLDAWRDQAGHPFAGEVRLMVQPDRTPSEAVAVRAVWPIEWIPSEWFS